ncbi:hypothetical protein Henu3_gp24 [Mycobacterium phage Henu3]|uniref:Uncharacterized protein n=1 Tax=Mycobacterium phage Henu3 TaxID=2492961 RepID=A0A410T7L6_9CAUD|nr:hypothetical protein I5G68_gp21 [Mycobacterium phage Henu3]QAU04968.1 hypothetical protein Henu3_gp24 [Mycobacterium phage Henu3]
MRRPKIEMVLPHEPAGELVAAGEHLHARLVERAVSVNLRAHDQPSATQPRNLRLVLLSPPGKQERRRCRDRVVAEHLGEHVQHDALAVRARTEQERQHVLAHLTDRGQPSQLLHIPGQRHIAVTERVLQEPRPARRNLSRCVADAGHLRVPAAGIGAEQLAGAEVDNTVRCVQLVRVAVEIVDADLQRGLVLRLRNHGLLLGRRQALQLPLRQRLAVSRPDALDGLAGGLPGRCVRRVHLPPRAVPLQPATHVGAVADTISVPSDEPVSITGVGHLPRRQHGRAAVVLRGRRAAGLRRGVGRARAAGRHTSHASRVCAGHRLAARSGRGRRSSRVAVAQVHVAADLGHEVRLGHRGRPPNALGHSLVDLAVLHRTRVAADALLAQLGEPQLDHPAALAVQFLGQATTPVERGQAGELRQHPLMPPLRRHVGPPRLDRLDGVPARRIGVAPVARRRHQLGVAAPVEQIALGLDDALIGQHLVDLRHGQRAARRYLGDDRDRLALDVEAARHAELAGQLVNVVGLRAVRLGHPVDQPTPAAQQRGRFDVPLLGADLAVFDRPIRLQAVPGAHDRRWCGAEHCRQVGDDRPRGLVAVAPAGLHVQVDEQRREPRHVGRVAAPLLAFLAPPGRVDAEVHITVAHPAECVSNARGVVSADDARLCVAVPVDGQQADVLTSPKVEGFQQV